MENLKIGFLLHFYQPWWQSSEVLSRIASECYWPIVRLLEKMQDFCFSANINYSLLELLDRDFGPVIYRFKKAVEEKKIEFLGSTAYHPIMPLIPKSIQTVEMIVDAQLKKALWGVEKNCNGIFLPEMVFSQNILPNLKDSGYKWTILGDAVFKAQYSYVPFDHVIDIQGDFKTLLRSNYWSNLIAGGKLNFWEFRRRLEYELPQWTKGQPAYLVIAMDAETFGHHHKNLITKFLSPMLQAWGNGGEGILTPLEEIIKLFPAKNFVKVEDGSWSTSQDDYWHDDPFPLWKSRYNLYHQDLWQLVNIALKYAEQPGASWDCMKIVSSCHWWWISRRSEWRPEFMKFGARKAFEVVRQQGTPEEIAEAKSIFEKLDSLK